MEHVHGLLYAIINLHFTSENLGTVQPSTLYDMARFAETLHKIHTFLEAQQDGNKLKNFFRQSELNTLLNSCRAGLQQALDAFKIDTSWQVLNNVAELQKKTKNLHNELQEFISTLSDEPNSDRSTSSLSRRIGGSQNSSNSFALLPPIPKIFNGRESELAEIVKSLSQGDSARIAILGAGGVGKTSLARAALHHPQILAKYDDRFFVACDSATSSIELAANIGSHLGLKPGKDLRNAVVRYLSMRSSCLLILDNLETPWEIFDSRAGIEEFLSLLTEVPHLALIITMRGAERPAKVRWTRPFILPLRPLTNDAARETFAAITDNVHTSEDINQLLSITDNMPLAVNLIAHLVDYEGCPNVLARWETERTALLSDGYDRKSSVDASIAISLASPRLTTGAKDLLSLLSILPDGLSEVELAQINDPLHDLRGSRTALLRTSLAYIDDRKQLKSLVPIREHMQQHHPPPPDLIQPLRTHFHLLLKLYQEYRGSYDMALRINPLSSNLGNIQSVLRHGLHPDNPDLRKTIECTLSLNDFRRISGLSHLVLMDHIPTALAQLCDDTLEVRYITELFNSRIQHPISNPEFLIAQATSHLSRVNDPVLQCEF
ncbi:P-loop containing nucleoside triphosphate hydrolase protein [Mycena latifolia]|nr:P-loop containing nucleoside triphosphate hydrolase protein [Mycena latifolia]